jgi:DNA repair photolyase
MRWDALRLADDQPAATSGGRVPLLPRGAVTRQFDTPEFRGITFHEVTARSALNKVPEASRMPFRWTINPYRGCSHACVYCFARKTHEYLDLDAGHDFDSQIVVKTNVGEVLRRELARPSWHGEHVAMGTNVDCYQRAEGRYQLMPDILRALTDAANPFSILTKGALLLRDLPLLEAAADVTEVSAAVSVGFLDDELWRTVEPGTPPPMRRLEMCAALNAAGVPTGVLMAPVLPFLTDSEGQLEQTVAAAASAGAQYVSPIVLHLRPGAREWWQAWLRREHPALVPRYRVLYGERANAPRDYQSGITEMVRRLADKHGIGRAHVLRRRTGHERAQLERARLERAQGSAPAAPTVDGRQAAEAVQLALL